jgi:hypothetical protein
MIFKPLLLNNSSRFKKYNQLAKVSYDDILTPTVFVFLRKVDSKSQAHGTVHIHGNLELCLFL